jgi:hypothetical protein
MNKEEFELQQLRKQIPELDLKIKRDQAKYRKDVLIRMNRDAVNKIIKETEKRKKIDEKKVEDLSKALLSEAKPILKKRHSVFIEK